MELREFYRLRIDLAKTGGSIFDLQSVAIYLFTRYGKEQRARFAAGMAIEVMLTKQERVLFLGWLRRNGLAHLLDNPGSYDDGRRGKGKERRQRKDVKERVTKPGRKGVSRVAQPDRGATAYLFPDDEGI